MTPQRSDRPILEVSGLCRRFGAVVAADDLNVAIPAGQVVGVIGANGAGKTTFVNMVTGWTRPSAGRIALDGRDITGLPPARMARLGVTRSFQMPQIFTSLTVAENLEIADGLRENGVRDLLRPMADAGRAERRDAVLARFSLQGWARRRVSELPQGARKLLDVAMATARTPRLLLLDEPTSGVAREEKFQLMDQVFAALEGTGVTILFVEHDMDVVTRYVSRVLAFVQGRIIADGPSADVLRDDAVREHVIGRGGFAAPAHG